jgi:uncharacterized phage protein (TIGR01671 family)
MTMREILFRGKRVDNGEWVEGCYIENCISHASGCAIIEDYFEKYDVKPDAVGQYTGLTDKNGKRIFEGDIVKAADTDDPDLVGEIVLNMCSWLVSGSNWSDSLFRANEVHALEVIGNVHDNPELIAEVEGNG